MRALSTFISLFVLCCCLTPTAVVHGVLEVKLEQARNGDHEHNYTNVGRLLVRVNGEGSEWGTVCGPITDKSLYKLLCRSVGLPADYAYAINSYPDGQGLILGEGLSCTNTNAQTVNDGGCSFQSYSTLTEKKNKCTHMEDVGLACFGTEGHQWSSAAQNAWFNITSNIQTESLIKDRVADILNLSDVGAGDPTKQVQFQDSTIWLEENDRRWKHYSFRFGNATSPVQEVGSIDWMSAVVLHEYSDSYLWEQYQFYNVMSNFHNRMINSTAMSNINFWSWRLDEKDPNQAGAYSTSTVYGDAVRTGRVAMRPAQNDETAMWGTMCGTNFSPVGAAAICNTIAGSNKRTPYTVLPIFYYGGGDGPIWLSDVRCNENSSTLLTFDQTCNHYTLSQPNDRGSNYCDHSLDVGLNCQADETNSDYTVKYTAFVLQSSVKVSTRDTPQGQLAAKICDLFGVPRYRFNYLDHTQVLNNGYYVINFEFIEPDSTDRHRPTRAALEQAIDLMRPEGLKLAFGMDQLLKQLIEKKGTPAPTPAPPRDVTLSYFSITYKHTLNLDEILQKLASFAGVPMYMLVTVDTFLVFTQGKADGRYMKRTEFFVRGPPVLPALTQNTTDKLELLTSGDYKTAQLEILFDIESIQEIQKPTKGTNPPVVVTDSSASTGKTVFIVVALVLILAVALYFVYHRYDLQQREEQLYQHVGRGTLTEERQGGGGGGDAVIETGNGGGEDDGDSVPMSDVPPRRGGGGTQSRTAPDAEDEAGRRMLERVQEGILVGGGGEEHHEAAAPVDDTY